MDAVSVPPIQVGSALSNVSGFVDAYSAVSGVFHSHARSKNTRKTNADETMPDEKRQAGGLLRRDAVAHGIDDRGQCR